MKHDLYSSIAKKEGISRDQVKMLSIPIIYGVGNNQAFKGKDLEEKIHNFIKFVKMIRG